MQKEEMRESLRHQEIQELLVHEMALVVHPKEKGLKSRGRLTPEVYVDLKILGQQCEKPIVGKATFL